jgi:hypothetical protein
MASLEEAKQFLKRDVGGHNLYDHLSDVLLKLLVDKPADALESFEHLSAAIKKLSFAPKPIPDYADDVDDAQTTRIAVSTGHFDTSIRCRRKGVPGWRGVEGKGPKSGHGQACP